MRARAADRPQQRVVPRHQRALAKQNFAGRRFGGDVQADDRVHALHRAVFDHPLRAADVLLVRRFLGGLEDETDAARRQVSAARALRQ